LLAATLVSLFVCAPLTCAGSKDAPCRTAKFSAYDDINSVKQPKVAWNLNFVDPKTVGMVPSNFDPKGHEHRRYSD